MKIQQSGGFRSINGSQLTVLQDYAERNLALSENFENVLEYIGKKEEERALWYPVMVNGQPKMADADETEKTEAAPIAEDPTVSIYPNPTNDMVTVSYTLPNASGTVYVSLYNLMGQKLKEITAQNANGAERFSTKELPNGVYVVTIKDEHDVQHTGKLVVQH